MPPRPPHPLAAMLGLGLVAAAAAAVWAVQETWAHPSFPAIDWLRMASVEMRRSFLFGALLLLAATRAAGATGWRRGLALALLAGGAAVVGANLLLPQAWRFSVLAEAGGVAPVPVVVDGRLERRGWETELVPCVPVTCAGRILADQWTTSDLAHGMHAEAVLAFETARKAEKAWQYELGLTTAFVQYGYWDSLKKGLLAGERLQLDLERMDAAYLDSDARRAELTKHVSLGLVDPIAVELLRSTGECWFNLPGTSGR